MVRIAVRTRAQPSASAVSSRKRATSTLPPDRIDARRAGRRRRPCPCSSAASADAPLGSSTSFSRSKANRIAATISASRDGDDRGARARGSTGNVRSPGVSSCWPSAIVRRDGHADALAGGERARACRRRPRARRRSTRHARAAAPSAAVAQPGDQPAAADRARAAASSAPPSSISSSAAVPWPAMIALVVVGVHDRQPVALGALAPSSASRSSRVAVEAHDRARRSPRSRRPSTRARPRGMRIVAGRVVQRGATARAPARGCPTRRSRRRGRGRGSSEATAL